MSGWSDLAGQAASSLLGTLVGGAITILVARWQTAKTIGSQGELAASQQAAAASLAHSERERERCAEAARQLLERLADLYDWLPALPNLETDQAAVSHNARRQCISAMKSIRRGMHTDLYSISDVQVRGRYRTLVKLVYDVGRRGIGRDHRARQIRDVRSYLRYVQFSLEAVIDGAPSPDQAAAPALDRGDSEPWLPPELPWYWGDPADGS
ncbi:hypothetical protein Stsp01_44050 [Streptomyces sp. NBRC 13847]|uniref:hypothetical protein n=1 Tax=Streptomyces TaxID=1883 RepID=UPI00249FC0C9|nr:hypothetical protein [Streptomyces sp. NBRC 13847]GLW17662.1 hypothetical protein Stsp01_44050 [Streptomyces sp. NBRC 13847]